MTGFTFHTFLTCFTGMWYNTYNINTNGDQVFKAPIPVLTTRKASSKMATSDSTSTLSKRKIYICETCRISFERYECQMKGKSHAYCSRACLGTAKKHGDVLYCHFCDTSFYRRAAEQDLGVKINQFCSNECYNEWRALKRKSTTYIKSGSKHLHRIVAENYLGRPLTSDEVVHHIDLNKHNNEPSNLAVLPSQAYHMSVHQGKVSNADLRRFSLK